MLAILGANVLTLGRLGEPDRGLPQVRGRGGETSYLAAFLDQYKTSVDALDEGMARADIVVCDRSGDLPNELITSDIGAYVDAVKQHNRAAWVTISPFGLSGPYRDLLSGDLCDLAAGGALSYTRTAPGARPTKLAGRQGPVLIGAVAAVAGLHAHDGAVAAGEPVHMDLSAQEVMVATGPFLECGRLLWNCGDPNLANFGTPQGAIPCADGEVLLYVIEDRHWDGLLKAMGHPAWAAPYVDKVLRRAEESVVIAGIAEWSGKLPKSECADVLQRCGVPASPINDPADAMTSEQFRARGFIETLDAAPWPGHRMLGFPGTVDRIDGAADGDSGPVRTLSSLKILDVTHVLGPPLASSWLGSMGAQVVKVEDVNRVELYRRAGPFADGVAGMDRSSFFGSSNFGKSGITLDLRTPDGRAELDHLLEWADVLIENQSANHAAELGLTDDLALKGTFCLSSSGFGRNGPLRGHRAYGQNLMAYAGLTALSRDEAGRIVTIGTPWADVVTGVLLAATMAAYGVSSRRDIQRIDVSMAEVVARHIPEYLLAEAAGEVDASDVANDRYPFAPHGVYRSADGEWLALSIVGDDDWAAFCALFPTHDDLRSPEYKTIDDRYANRRSLDALLDTLFVDEPAAPWFRRLQDAGVRAAPVWNAADLIVDPHLAARGYFVAQVHGDAGVRKIAGLPWRRVDEPPLVPRAAPQFQANDASGARKNG
jgi:crotonobetainyl-CoA:carnitine CoA-transferase CaiB-like acyl-CoA transferase